MSLRCLYLIATSSTSTFNPTSLFEKKWIWDYLNIRIAGFVDVVIFWHFEDILNTVSLWNSIIGVLNCVVISERCKWIPQAVLSWMSSPTDCHFYMYIQNKRQMLFNNPYIIEEPMDRWCYCYGEPCVLSVSTLFCYKRDSIGTLLFL